MATFTPGPWRLSRTGLGVVAGELDPLQGWPNGRPVLETVLYAVPREERLANALLAASAPDLLSVCELILSGAEPVSYLPLVSLAVRKAKGDLS